MLLFEIKKFIGIEFLHASGILARLIKFSLKYEPWRDQRPTPDSAK